MLSFKAMPSSFHLLMVVVRLSLKVLSVSTWKRYNIFFFFFTSALWSIRSALLIYREWYCWAIPHPHTNCIGCENYVLRILCLQNLSVYLISARSLSFDGGIWLFNTSINFFLVKGTMTLFGKSYTYEIHHGDSKYLILLDYYRYS